MVYIGMKRSREGDLDNSLTTMANYLILLSRSGGGGGEGDNHFGTNNIVNSPAGRVFECKTCNRQFPSFQALGGHRASHKKPRLMDGGVSSGLPAEPAKPKTHECSICGVEFAIGQALGGHMRRHRGGDNRPPRSLSPPPAGKVAVVKKGNGGRVMCLDLNLTPYENDLEFRVGKAAPVVDFYL